MNGDEWQQFDQVEATFQPRRTSDLRIGAADWIGRRLTWQAMWVIDPEDGRDFVGQMAWMPTLAPGDARPPFAWAPTEDLSDVVRVAAPPAALPGRQGDGT